MRYVDTTELLLKRDQWGNGAELWKDDRLKKDFKECFCGKCWYSEVLLIGQDVHIDHFRPKGEVKAYGQFSFNEPLRATGYAWLAKEWFVLKTIRIVRLSSFL